ncbi:MAG: c-type cytochrome [Firmicutes bacterium]|nr:c-type cytochrome [Bacillota bacterium]
MRNPRKYLVIGILSSLLVVLLLFNGGRELFRMAAAAERQNYQYAAVGAKLYAQYCMTCHGPRGEGVVGLPLNRPDLQGDPRDPLKAETLRMLVSTITNGRPGTSTPRWEKVDDNHYISYTAMPAWGREAGGPLDEYQVQALAYFIMMGNQKVDPENPNSLTFWDAIGSTDFPAPPTNPPAEQGGIKATPIEEMPDAAGLTPEENRQAKLLIRDKINPSCLACHTIGNYGGAIGPDLTYVGTWGVDEEWLRRWISDPKSVPGDQRMPVYWASSRVNAGPEPDLSEGKKIVAEPSGFMPSFGDKLSPEEMDLLVRYLMGLGKK